MELLYLELLGSPHIRLGEQPLTGFATAKAQALLFYLAMTQRVHTRDVLASLFWCDMPDRPAKKNLRNTLPNLRALVGTHLIITRHSVAFNRASPYRLDVEVFRSALAVSSTANNLQALYAALALYRDDFLVGFYVRGAPAFEEWVLMEREYLRTVAIDGYTALAQQCIEQHAYELGLAATQRLLALDSWRENAHQYRMLMLAHTGQRSAALAQYNICRTTLADAFDVEPLAETTALYEQIKSGMFEQQWRTYSPLSLASRVELQVDWTEFPRRPICYGRHNELVQLYEWLLVDRVSLVGICGIAGQGKTTLAAQLAWALVDGDVPAHTSTLFERIIWRSLSNMPPFTTILHGWLTALADHGIIEVPARLDEQLVLLFDYLQRQRCLLILDDADRLLPQDSSNGQLPPVSEAYMQLLSQISHRVHPSCLVVVSRENPLSSFSQARETTALRVLPLRGLSEQSGVQLLRAEGLVENDKAMTAVVTRHSGHPLALKLVAMTIRQFFAGDMEAFVTEAPPILDDLRHLLAQQLTNLSALEKKIMRRLAVLERHVSFGSLWDHLDSPPSKRDVLEALWTLQRRSLIETWDDGFGLPNMLMEYIMTCWGTREAPERE